MGPQSAAIPRQRLSFTEIALSLGTVIAMIRTAQFKLSGPCFNASPERTSHRLKSAVGG